MAKTQGEGASKNSNYTRYAGKQKGAESVGAKAKKPKPPKSSK